MVTIIMMINFYNRDLLDNHDIFLKIFVNYNYISLAYHEKRKIPKLLK